MDRLCLDCGKALKGRADKKFCDDLCRNSYNNHLKVEDHSLVKKVNQILKKNRTILAKYNPEGKTKIGKNTLLQSGFNLDYFTSIYQTQKGATYFFCYEYGYLPLEGDAFLLVKREER